MTSITTIPLTDLIPQRAPILMVDALIGVEGSSAITRLSVRTGNIFVNDDDGTLDESGLIEHIAQSAAALAGYQAGREGATAPAIGYLAEVKDFCCQRLPRVGEELRTIIRQGLEVNGIRVIEAETYIHEERVARVQLKLFMDALVGKGGGQ